MQLLRSLLRRSFPLLGAATALALAPSAWAHFVWVERDASGGVAAWFGEWADGVRETQDGYLKLIAAPTAIAADGRSLPVEVQHDRIAIATDGGSGEVRFANLYFPEKGATLVHYQARLGRQDPTALLPLEVVPVAAGANVFTVVLRGQPLPGAEVRLFTAPGWSRLFKADAAGRVTIETPWPGQAILEVTHLDKTAGQHAGRAYEAIRHVATLTFTVAAQ